MKNNKLVIFLTLLFFLVGLFTIKDYGVSWDSINHFFRGQAYLNFFLTGSKSYDNLSDNYRRSFYQSSDKTYDANFYLGKGGGGHPPLNGELAAFTNYIFYQKLGIMGDVESHHLFILLSSTLLVLIVLLFSQEILGIFGMLISYLSLITYPLFFSESHFNIKDPVHTAFYAGFIWSFYKSITSKNDIKWLWRAIVFFALGLATKFNILFSVFILVPWLLVYFKFDIRKITKFVFKHKKYILVGLLGAVLSFGFLILVWPYLWQEFPDNLLKIFGYYKSVGLNARYQPESYFLHGINLYPTVWILLTTHPVVLLLSSIGIFFGMLNIKKNPVYFLWVLWFLVSIIRVSFPNASIYGGSRQIFEFIPALSLLSAVGAVHIAKLFRKNLRIKILLLLIFIWPTMILIKLHPNQNVYFNFLVGGLSGAKEKNIPAWGNTFGSVYKDGVQWLNKNAEPNSKITLIQGIVSNTPTIWYRKDLNVAPQNWSGFDGQGEYIMELTFDNTIKVNNFTWDYVNKYLKPVYEKKVDGVSVLKIWKNNKTVKSAEYSGDENTKVINNHVLVGFDKELELTEIKTSLDFNDNCNQMVGYIETSPDNLNWKMELDGFPVNQLAWKSNAADNELDFHFAGRNTRFVRVTITNSDECQLTNAKIQSIKVVNE